MTPRDSLIAWLYVIGMQRREIASYLRTSRSSVHHALARAGGSMVIRPAISDAERKGRVTWTSGQ